MPKKKEEQVEIMLDRKIVETRRGRYKKYLVKWKGLQQEDNTWILEESLKSLNEEKWRSFEEHPL